jgi:hypothetical protein
LYASDDGSVKSGPATFKGDLPPKFFSLNSTITRALELKTMPDAAFCALSLSEQAEQLDILEEKQQELNRLASKNVGGDQFISYAEAVSFESKGLGLQFPSITTFKPSNNPNRLAVWYNTTLIKEVNENKDSVMGDIYILKSKIKLHKILSSYSIEDLQRIEIFQTGAKFLLVGRDSSDETNIILKGISRKIGNIKMNFDYNGELIIYDEIYDNSKEGDQKLQTIIQIPVQSKLFTHAQISSKTEDPITIADRISTYKWMHHIYLRPILKNSKLIQIWLKSNSRGKYRMMSQKNFFLSKTHGLCSHIHHAIKRYNQQAQAQELGDQIIKAVEEIDGIKTWEIPNDKLTKLYNVLHKNQNILESAWHEHILMATDSESEDHLIDKDSESENPLIELWQLVQSWHSSRDEEKTAV